MRISLNWLRELVDLPDDANELADRLTMVGLAVDALQPTPDDTLVDLDVTANRGDCLSHLGVAREAAAIYDTPIRLPEVSFEEGEAPTGEAVEIRIADPDLCGRYCGRYIEGVQVGPSPDWLAKRIEAVGIRSINNVADITNLVLMELGQPLHAFDADKLAGGVIVVRRARMDESLRTLDGQSRRLGPDMLVIADAERAVALAGIMGGEDTEISTSSRNVLIESAWFSPRSVRKTARGLNLSTEASYRFERGTDIEMTRLACDRAAQLVQELAGGSVRAGMIDVYPNPESRPPVGLRRTRIGAYLGMEVPDEIVVRILTRLGFQVGEASQDIGWLAVAPGYRHDISREEDLLEEIARHYGYERFPATLPPAASPGRRLPWHEAEATVRTALSGLGYSETCSLVFSDPEIERAFAPDVRPFVIRNPLSEAEPVLRTSLIPSVLKVVQWNLNRGIRDLLFYEIGKIYPASGERRRLVLAASGSRQGQTLHDRPIESGFYQLKGDVETLLDRFEVNVQAESAELPDYYHPGRSVRFGTLATLGELAPDRQQSFKLRQRVCVAEIDVEALYAAGVRTVAVRPIPKYPAIRRDLSLLLDRKTRYGDLRSAIEGAGIEELIQVEPFDLLDLGPFPSSCYSLAIGLVYQAPDRTLTDEEVQGFESRVLVQLEKIGVKLRT